MKMCINDKGIAKRFVGKIPNGWRLMTNAEFEERKTREIKKYKIKTELLNIYDMQDEYLKLQLISIKEGLERAFDENEYDKITAIFTSPYLPENVRPVAEQIYNKYLELTGGENGQ